LNAIVAYLISVVSLMPPTLQQLGLDRYSPEDRLAVAEAIWDSVVQETLATPLTPAQKAELERRLADSIAHPNDVIPWEAIKARALAKSTKSESP
jgi:putative addiction module component (TIGR02574 family)